VVNFLGLIAKGGWAGFDDLLFQDFVDERRLVVVCAIILRVSGLAGGLAIALGSFGSFDEWLARFAVWSLVAASKVEGSRAADDFGLLAAAGL
jgi:hypothetical protein